jgi:hypothetical protein
MAQGILPFVYEQEKKGVGTTALGGLPVYLDLAQVIGLVKSVQKHLKTRTGEQGWTDKQMLISLVMLNLAGGDCVEDLKRLEKDDGFCEILMKAETHGLKRKERRTLEKRWRKERCRTVPSPSATFRWLEAFHDAEQENYRQPGKAFIPRPNANLKALLRINKDVVAFVQIQSPQSIATLDMDGTLVETSKEDALYGYTGEKTYQPLNTWWAEQWIIIHSEFRDGNVPAGFDQLRVFIEALEQLPQGVEKVMLRSDTAAYQHDLLKYCEMGKNERFGRIEFAIGCDVTRAFKQAVAEVEESEWKPIHKKINGKWEKTGTQWAEVCFVPNAIAHSKNGPEYRYLATRKALEEQLELPGMEKQLELPFPVMPMKGKRYKVFGMVTNMDWDGEEIIRWQRERCGKSEEAHAVMKEDLAGGKLPCGEFGKNAAWWGIMILALNLDAIMKRLVLGKSWETKRMKAIRFSLINLPGRVIKRSRKLILRLTKGHPSFELLIEARTRITLLLPVPAG